MTARFLLLAALAVAVLQAAPKRTILAVFAHPDDEIGVGPVLARYADEGHEVYLATITSGQRGAGNTDIPAGEQLGRARESEVRCSARKLGIHEPFLLGFEDGNTANRAAMEPITKRLAEIINKVKPDIMITFDPGGSTGHPDHRTASNVATEAFQRHRRLTHPPSKLYYVVLPESLMPDPIPPGLHPRTSPVHDSFITTVIDGSKYAERTFEAMQCHQTQWAPLDRMKRMFDARIKLLGGKIYLRLALSTINATSAREDNLLAGLPAPAN